MSVKKHILEPLVAVREHGPSVEIKIDPTQDKATIFKGIQNILTENRVVNADLPTIKSVIEKESNAFEPIGPIFVYYQEEYDSYLITKIKALRATLMVKREYLDEDFPLTVDVLRYKLKKKGWFLELMRPPWKKL
ncbi:hypothetical protein [Chitinivibrio alkaliphilus]|uniref:Uncharacterized protein n=1 Tax=Chitinivibrio alkaliphilus ACht1 TaxID=1313304 RepID=U7D5J7_9BACT|nr:hypothetical protein [Chitinivibrio alkaliphilus]ERP31804.1 hypothetical protein CALK_1250 [Chitinivibrio alkaliphilus ACht1]